ncbi:hypothetical protein BJY24_004156 [Nocardia transvalensis]|uniref:Uncharacterized protein n=1 Tax=Nocardia transvalensis TaxID=37333 RepID=A0A7W9UJB3_9NOCA|nr:hypothetical protein [Nocardia transvalensis]MBB5915289.1 hypothetical protein [Nocardia transvalensis]
MGYGYVAHRRVVVNLLSGIAIAGVITKWRGPFYVLRDAAVHEGDNTAPADGEVLVDKANVDYIQAL